jgi:hypothetical protein
VVLIIKKQKNKISSVIIPPLSLPTVKGVKKQPTCAPIEPNLPTLRAQKFALICCLPIDKIELENKVSWEVIFLFCAVLHKCASNFPELKGRV